MKRKIPDIKAASSKRRIDNNQQQRSPSTSLHSSSSTTTTEQNTTTTNTNPLSDFYPAEGLFAIYKPLNWTSQDAVAYIRRILERDARNRGHDVIPPGRKKRGKNKHKKSVKIGHGGTLDPLAAGVLVLGVGRGTKELQSYLTGAKSYEAGVQLGYETTTLDSEGTITQHLFSSSSPTTTTTPKIEKKDVVNQIPNFKGTIQQIPPLYSAIRVDGKRLYEEARKHNKTEKDVEIKAREVKIYELNYLEEVPTIPGIEEISSSKQNEKTENEAAIIQKYQNVYTPFGLSISCGGGTYIRSLVRDLGRALDSKYATMISLVRTKQGPFTLGHCLKKEDWEAERIYECIRESEVLLQKEKEKEEEEEEMKEEEEG